MEAKSLYWYARTCGWYGVDYRITKITTRDEAERQMLKFYEEYGGDPDDEETLRLCCQHVGIKQKTIFGDTVSEIGDNPNNFYTWKTMCDWDEAAARYEGRIDAANEAYFSGQIDLANHIVRGGDYDKRDLDPAICLVKMPASEYEQRLARAN